MEADIGARRAKWVAVLQGEYDLVCRDIAGLSEAVEAAKTHLVALRAKRALSSDGGKAAQRPVKKRRRGAAAISAMTDTDLKQELAQLGERYKELASAMHLYQTSQAERQRARQAEEAAEGPTTRAVAIAAAAAAAPQVVVAPARTQSSSVRWSTRWTPQDDELLRVQVAQFGARQWKRISAAFGGRFNGTQCLHRWNKVTRPGLLKGPWSAEEDEVLASYVHACKQSGARVRWVDVAAKLPGRIGKQCRERWLNHLSPDLRKEPWTLEEDRTLHRLHAEMGNKWTLIAKQIAGRSENAVKNRLRSAAHRDRVPLATATATTARSI